MIRTTRSWRVAAAAVAASLTLASCGNGDDGNDEAEGDGGDGSSESGEFTLGYVLPETGDLAYLGPPQIQALNYAIDQINAAGGVLGSEIPAPVAGDEANDASIAAQSADRVLNDGVSAIIGAAASGMSLAIIDKITGAGVAQCSGSNTAPTFTDYDDNGLYFRTAPSDALQGPILADVIVGDGYSNVAIVARADDYGQGLADATAEALESAGATVVLNETYDPKTTNFDATVQQVVSSKPDAAVVIAFEEGKQILQGLIESGLTPDEGVGLYGADGLRADDLAELVSPSNPGVLAGMKGTAPASAGNDQFLTDLKKFAPDLEEVQFAPQVFDCVNILALAAEAADSSDANEFKEFVNDVTADGEKCTTFADCKELLEAGEDIDYDGASGPLEFTEAGEPGEATIEVYGFNKKGELETLDTRTSVPLESD
ncbi:MAG TPA: ABC transporter substrate-binding protein [Marmoricola sp.]|nr:ABC transporter substrate-binding protein [Marmoricola sp.]